ncbi:MAG: chalcone isomerase family protein [Desulfobacterota bacterium]|nr:chalcone isomerase family protein [Thermodesulfobacteriota bacterium]
MKTSCLLCVLCCVAATGYARDIAGTAVPETLAARGVSLKLNGAGVRTKFFMDIYVGSLYLLQPRKDPGVIIRSDEPMAIRLQILSSLISSDKMEAATREGFQNATGGAVAPLRDEIERFIEVFRETIVKNDVYEMIYVPGDGTQIYKNGTLKTTISGLPFKQALFGIWLCEKPAQESLKQQMLGR